MPSRAKMPRGSYELHAADGEWCHGCELDPVAVVSHATRDDTWFWWVRIPGTDIGSRIGSASTLADALSQLRIILPSTASP